MKSFYMTVVFLLLSSGVFAQRLVRLWGNPVDAYTRDPIANGKIKVSLLTKDSVLVMQDTAKIGIDQGSGIKRSHFLLKVPEQENSNFILRLEHPDYQTTYKDIKLRWVKKNETSIGFWAVPMRRKPVTTEARQLGEATVTASKIKFYAKGDTLVYNASAFQLQEGSMLDALIKQLPGVELKDDGRIFVDGKFVESLLLNGKDFFKGDNTVLLDNLPGYMVNSVQVYTKESEMSELLGKKVDEGSFVMDVKLKKQYSIGWIANTEWGVGTKDRYLGRLFALRFTPHSRLTFFGNLNNVNARRKPDGQGGWEEISPSRGLTATKRGGLDYLVEDKYERFRVSGDVDVNYTDNDNNWGGLYTNFFTNGNVYDSKKSLNNTTNLNVSTNHWLKLDHRGEILTYRMDFSPSFQYSHNDSRTTNLLGSFNNPPSEHYSALLDTLFSPNWTKTAQNMVKRYGEWGKGDGDSYNASFNYFSYWRIPFTNNGLNLEGNVNYRTAENANFNKYVHSYFENNSLAEESRNRYIDSPESDFNYYLLGKAILHVTDNLMINPSYTFTSQYSTTERSTYLLDLLPESSDTELGWLPSLATDLLSTIDNGNSYRTGLHRYRHEVVLDGQWNYSPKDANGNNDGRWYIRVVPSFVHERNKFHYMSVGNGQYLNKTFFLPKLNIHIENQTKGFRHRWEFNSNIVTAAPYLLYLVNRRDENDPTNISVSNPGLKKSTTFYNQFWYNSQKWLQERERRLSGGAGFSITRQATAISWTYDKQTGVSENRPVNVNGNWEAWGAVNFSTPLDKKRKLSLNTNTNVHHWHYVDYGNSNAGSSSQRIVTNSFLLDEALTLTYRFNKVKIEGAGSVAWNPSSSNLENYTDVSTVSFRYGLNAVVDLPWQFQVSTGITMYSRRGYDSDEMNSNDLVWNIRLAKTAWGGRLQFMLDGFDLLGNLTNVSYGTNGRGSWEYYYNTIPRYALLHVVYRLNREPKKK